MASREGAGGDELQGGASSAAGIAGASFKEHVRAGLLSVLALTLLAGIVFPLALFAIAVPLFPRQASGSLIWYRGSLLGSALIGQEFTGPEWFHPRPSAAGKGYDATASGGTNLAPDNRTLKEGDAHFVGIRALAAAYRRQNGLAADALIPIDAVTRSGSGLDPDISPANAYLQVARVARARGLEEAVVRRLVAQHLVPPQLGFLGEARVPVLELNLALDRLAPPDTAAARANAVSEAR